MIQNDILLFDISELFMQYPNTSQQNLLFIITLVQFLSISLFSLQIIKQTIDRIHEFIAIIIQITNKNINFCMLDRRQSLLKNFSYTFLESQQIVWSGSKSQLDPVYYCYFIKQRKIRKKMQLKSKRSIRKTEELSSPPRKAFLTIQKKTVKSSHSIWHLPAVSSTQTNINLRKPSPFFDSDTLKCSNKIITTDESNRCTSSNEQISINNHIKTPTRPNFSPLRFKEKKPKTRLDRKKGNNVKGKQGKVEELALKLREMRSLEKIHQSQVVSMRDIASNHELGRLLKIHSVEKLRIIEELKLLRRQVLRSQRC